MILALSQKSFQTPNSASSIPSSIPHSPFLILSLFLFLSLLPFIILSEVCPIATEVFNRYFKQTWVWQNLK